ncbi:hypothetical protein [Aliarcobacter butzleri]|uniref:hypothetical protein n=1 Tax=Aliarcobacter butzleri TaxID=28197 RepID=UPI00263F1145|nr:hypothetical protein [Aliarcobacter butzleri]MDN5095787.1 hypothetical protein [Aliarcobacter butzleri]
MKGVILDFNNDDMEGLILGNDGNRYTFNIETDWQNKKILPEIDNLVDFIINDNKATQIYCMNNKSLEPIETKNNEIPSNNINFKKIDFEKIEKELNSEENIKKIKIKLKKDFYLSIKVTISLIAIYLISYSFVEYFNIEPNMLMGIISVILIILILFFMFTIWQTFLDLFFSKNKLKEDIIENLYKKDLTIISYPPEKLNYKIIELITATENTLEDAKKELILEAFRLKADAIINYKHDIIKSSYVSGSKGYERKEKNATHTHNVEGVAIRLI